MKGICRRSLLLRASLDQFSNHAAHPVCVAEEEEADDDETLQKIEGPNGRMCRMSRRSAFGLGKHNPFLQGFFSVSAQFFKLPIFRVVNFLDWFFKPVIL